MPAITPLPTPPAREDPTTFSERADAFLGAFPLLQVEVNALEVALQAAASKTALMQFLLGQPNAGQVVLHMPVPVLSQIPAALVGSYGKAISPATAQSDYDLRKNGVSFGTMRFAAASSTATLIAATATAFSPGDTITVYAPAVKDATLADVGLAIKFIPQ